MRIFTSVILIILSGIVLAEEASYQLDSASSRAIPKFIGEVVLMKGEVLVRAKQAEEGIGVEVNYKVQEGDYFKTGEKSMVKVRMIDESYIALGPKSELEFSEFKYKTSKDRTAVYNAVVGQMRSYFKHKAQENQIKIISKTVSMGIRGTEILSNIFEHQGKSHTQIALLSGELNVINSMNGKIYQLTPGNHLRLVDDKKNVVLDEKVMVLSPSEIQMLIASDVDEMKGFRPFLDFAYLADETAAKVAPTKVIKPPIEEKNKTSTPGWKGELKKLNEALERNNKSN